MYWMITNRNVDATAKTFGDDFSDLSFWQNASASVDSFASWTPMQEEDFRQALVAIADTFPDPNTANLAKNKKQFSSKTFW